MTLVGNKPWADGPYQLISNAKIGVKPGQKPQGAQLPAQEMTIVHNFILRGLNSIYLQCVNVGKNGSQEDVDDFIGYSLQWSTMVSEHHETEETDVFPSIEKVTGKPGLMEGNVSQHAAFHTGLEHYEEYLQGVQQGKEKYDGLRLKRIIEEFAVVLQEHLTDEIGTLVKLDEYKDVDWAGWWSSLQKEILNKAQGPDMKTTTFPMVLTNHDQTFEDGVHAEFPPLPWIVKVLFRWFYLPVHKAWWRFSACDYYGNPQELPFA